jgi:hypothetical protein
VPATSRDEILALLGREAPRLRKVRMRERVAREAVHVG